MDIISLDSAFLPQINSLVSDAFEYQHPHTFFDDFPIWKSTQAQHFGVVEHRKLISHVGIVPSLIQTSHGQEKVCLLGAVATLASHRGRGYSSAVLKAALEKCDSLGASWTFLWGSEHELYGNFGFHLSGVQGRVSLTQLAGVLPRPSEKIKTGLSESIFKFLVQRKTGLQLSENDRSWMFQHKTVQWYSLESPFAFIAFERGKDLPHLIHECGGDAGSLKVLFNHILSLDPLAGLIGNVPDLVALGFRFEDIQDEYLCLARPLKSGQKWDPEFWVSGIQGC